MSRLFMFEKPLGMRDTLPELHEAKEKVRSSIQKEMKQWGFQFIETPALEYYETVGSASAILDQQLFKLLDQQGHTLVLRPDMTAPIARVAASKLFKDQVPLRLAYSENVYRAQQREGGRPAEFEQIGVECIGDGSVSADGEMISLAISSLKKAGLEQFQLSVGHVGFVNELFVQILGTEERARELTKFLYEKNYVGYREHVKALPLSSIDSQRLLAFLELRGGPEVIDRASELVENGKGKAALDELKLLFDIIKDFGGSDRIKFDLTIVSHMSYYTGILFEVYAGMVGFPIGNGGRYDKLLEKFGKSTGATGFAIRLDRLLESLGNLSEPEPFTCILFSHERRKEAYQLAAQRREDGERVILQDISAVGNLDACSAAFADVVYLVGKEGAQ
ncbi:ATP phosphoribosyltransferase regulatory subunit [Mesobacillus subterraneus]|uniref:ATP phosphoribosyltransferase regulatory subunit n=1 Tax=Mesobacillus subterraneus TaxID=285983 RepID=UPI001CFC7888|nr:ATP phosphoribosyltransferase regulatory subunit [Mesobacillus subterraneus]